MTSGIPLSKAINSLSYNLKSIYLKENISILKESINRGNTLSASLKYLDCISDITISFIFSGEESGRLEENIKMLSNILEKDFDEKVNMATKFLEPIIVMFLGGMVIVMMGLIFIPVYECIKYV